MPEGWCCIWCDDTLAKKILMMYPVYRMWNETSFLYSKQDDLDDAVATLEEAVSGAPGCKSFSPSAISPSFPQPVPAGSSQLGSAAAKMSAFHY